MFAYCYMLNLPLTGKTRRSNSARKKIVDVTNKICNHEKVQRDDDMSVQHSHFATKNKTNFKITYRL